MSQFRFYIDGTELQNQPVNWQDFEEILEYDRSIKGLLLKYPIDLEFVGDGYRAIRAAYNTNGYCYSLPVTIDYKCGNGNFETLLNGLIFLSDCVFNLDKCTVNVPIEDNNFGAKIFNNKNIKAVLDVPFSKNGVSISECTPEAVTFFTPSTGINIGGAPRRCFDVFNAFQFLVRFMTDGEMNVVSDWYSGLNDDEKLLLVQGQELREHTAVFIPNISFQQLFTEIDKLYNIGFAVEKIAGVYTMRIEPLTYWQDSTTSVTINDIANLKQSFYQDELYSSVTLGSGKVAKYDNAIHSFPPIKFLGHQQEDYTIQGECNIDNELELQLEFISDSNIIEELVSTNTTNEDYDDDVFIVQYRRDTVPFEATKCYIITQSPNVPALYNEVLTNQNVSTRFNIQGNIAKYLGASPDTFRAEQTIGFIPSGLGLDQVEFNDDYTAPNFDNNNTYGNGTIQGNPVSAADSRYTATDIGIYVFYVYVEYNHLTGGSSTPFFRLIRYNSGGSAISISPDTFVPINPSGSGSITWSTILDTGDYVIVVSSGGNEEILPGSYFECISASNGGGIFEPKDAANYFVSRLEFDKPLSNESWKEIKDNPANAIALNSGTYNGWIRKITRKPATGQTDWELKTSINNIA